MTTLKRAMDAMEPRKVEGSRRDRLTGTVEFFLSSGKIYIYAEHGHWDGTDFLGASFDATHIPALRKWARALVKACDDKSLKVDA